MHWGGLTKVEVHFSRAGERPKSLVTNGHYFAEANPEKSASNQI